MTDPFVHLRTASGFSLRHGACHPERLVERAAEHGMDALALTDRDGMYGAVKFAGACARAGIRPILGVDLAVGEHSPSGRRAPARGGAFVDPGLPRATFLAGDGRGWAALCRLVSATHRTGERGTPVCRPDLLATHLGAAPLAEAGVVVLLGPASDVGRALAVRRPDLAAAALARWRAAVGAAELVVEVVHHRGPGDLARAARLLGFAASHRLPAVLTNAVRYADPADAPTVDVLDAARRLVALDARHVDRANAEGYLKSGKEMALLAEDVVTAAGLGADIGGVGAAGRAGRELLAGTRRIAERCVLDPRADLGIGEVHFPELEVGADGNRAVAAGADAVLRQRCVAGLDRRGLDRRGLSDLADIAAVHQRLDHELAVVAQLGFPSYFLTVADVVGLIQGMGVRCAARGSGAGSLINYLLGISDVDPLRYGLSMERFLSPLRQSLPDIDIDVESARRTEVYERILERYGEARCVCVSMMDTYRVRHAIRDVGGALGLPPGEIDAMAKAFPRIRAGHVREALAELPELRGSGLSAARLDVVFSLVERLDGLPRHIALHPCGVLLSDATLLDRTPVEESWQGFPMSQFDKDDVEELGLLKLDVLGVRMQSAISHALDEVERVAGDRIDIDAVPRDDPATFDLVRSTRTLGCFQIESPGQRELIGKFGPETFDDLIIDISLFRPGPVSSDMVRPFLDARQGWRGPVYPHPDLVPALAETYGVVVFHEQVLAIAATMTGCSLAEADEVRRALGDPDGRAEAKAWFLPAASRHGYDAGTVEGVWAVLEAFASFGFCKAHAAAFAVPTYQSAWLKTHHPAAFFAGVLTHDPGMYPQRLILDDARQFGVAVLGLDVNISGDAYAVERVDVGDRVDGSCDAALDAGSSVGSGVGYGIRLPLSQVKGITDAEVARIVAGRPYATLVDFCYRAAVSRPVAERLVLTGAFDSLYGIGSGGAGGGIGPRRGGVTRRDLLLQLAELSGRRTALGTRGRVTSLDSQLTLGGNDGPEEAPLPPATGLPEMSAAERVRAEVEVLGLDASAHVLAFYEPFLAALGVTRARDLLRCRSRSEVLVAGVKVATQTPPVRSGRRIVFVTLDDATGPIDVTFFADAQVGYAATVFHSWLLVIRGTVRRTGARGVSINADACWELPELRQAWANDGDAGVRGPKVPPKVWHASPGSAGR